MSKWFRCLTIAVVGSIGFFANAGSVDLGDASGYTLVIKEDFTYATGDVQGYSAIGGTITNLSGQQDYFGHQIDLFDIEAPAAISDFTETFDYLSGLSQQLASYTETGTVVKPWSSRLDFQAAAGNENQDVHIFNVDISELQSVTEIRYTGIESGQVIVNVTGSSDSTLRFGGQFFGEQQLDYADNSLAGRVGSDIMFNFVDAAALDYSGSLYASVLAPNTDITATGAATFWGQVIANSWYTDQSSQFNYDLFANVKKDVIAVSEPGTFTLLMLALLGMFWRRQRV